MAGTSQKKHDILRTLGSNLTLKDRQINIQAPDPFVLIEKALTVIPEAAAKFEPEIIAINKRENHALSVVNPTWLPPRDRN